MLSLGFGMSAAERSRQPAARYMLSVTSSTSPCLKWKTFIYSQPFWNVWLRYPLMSHSPSECDDYGLGGTSGGLKVCFNGCDEHFEGQRHLNLSETTGQKQRVSFAHHCRVIASWPSAWKTNTGLNVYIKHDIRLITRFRVLKTEARNKTFLIMLAE